MRNLVQRWLTGILVISTLLGGMASALMSASNHAEAAPALAAPNAFWAAHGRDAHWHDHRGHFVTSGADTTGVIDTSNAPSTPSGDSGHWCAHDHRPCCAAAGMLDAMPSSMPIEGRGARLLDRFALLRAGQLLYPPLRPPIALV